MALETLEFDAAGSTVAGGDPGSPLVVMSGSANYYVTAFASSAPAPKVQWTNSIDMDGGRRADPSTYENRQVTLTIEPRDTAGSSTHEDALRAKAAKVHREGGTLKWTRKDGSVRIFDLLASDGFSTTIDVRYENGRPEVQLSFVALPGMRGPEQDLGDNVETTLPALIFTEASVPGDLYALGRLVIDNDDASNNQWWVVWGIESRNYSSSANAALFYEAESRTAMGGSATAAGPSGASGGGSNVMRNASLATSFQAVLSTQASGGGAHLSHVGWFRVFARVQVPTTNTGAVAVALEWGTGDFRRFTANATVQLSADWEGTWRLVDLGVVGSLERVISGTQQWEGRVLARSTVAGDDIDIDWLLVVPVAEGSGEASAISRQPSPTSFSARDDFDQTAGALTGKTLPAGGTWTGAGDADDFNVSGSGTMTRTAVSDSSSISGGRYVTASTPTLANTVAEMALPTHSDILFAPPFANGLIARYVDVNNWLCAQAYAESGLSSFGFRVVKRVAGTTTVLGSSTMSAGAWNQALSGRLRLAVDASGTFTVWAASLSDPVITGYDAVLATGGTLDDGKVGIYDAQASVTANTRTYTDFWATTYVSDAAVFASQSLEVRHDGVRREDSGGTLWVPPSSYIGDYLLVPPSGAEARTLRCAVKASRNAPGKGPDSGTDDISARLFVTPRYL